MAVPRAALSAGSIPLALQTEVRPGDVRTSAGLVTTDIPARLDRLR